MSSLSGVYHQPSEIDTDDFTEESLRRFSRKLGVEWEKLATFLNLSYDVVGKLKCDYTGTEERTFQMLLAFKKRSSTGQRGMADQLETALREIGRVDLVEFVRLEMKQRRAASTAQQLEKIPLPSEDKLQDKDISVLYIDESRPEVAESQDQSTLSDEPTEQDKCKELSFNLIQSLVVPCIINRVHAMSMRNCYGCKLPIEDDVTQTNHECMMDSVSHKVSKYFDLVLDEVVDSDLEKLRSEWNKIAKENDRIVNQFPTVHARNRLFYSYVDKRITKSHSDLYDICYGDGW